MLKIKSKLNYRRGGQSKSCGGCDHFRREHPIVGIGGENLGCQPRCKVIGLQPGRMYRVAQNYVCDRFTNEQGLRRLLGERAYAQFVEKNHEAA